MNIEKFIEIIKEHFVEKETDLFYSRKFKGNKTDTHPRGWYKFSIMQKYTRKTHLPVDIKNIDKIILNESGIVRLSNKKDDSEVKIYLKDIRNILVYWSLNYLQGEIR